MESGDWAKRYDEVRPYVEKLTRKLSSLLAELLAEARIDGSVESRVKARESFLAKIQRPDKSYADPIRDVTDLSAIRVVVRTTGDVQRVNHLLTSEFEIDQERSIDKGAALDVDQFGYRSQHFIIRLREPRVSLSEWKDLGGYCSEVQIRTILQHAWAAIQHPLDYKSAHDIPKELRRRLFRLSALFELADEELQAISTDAIRLFEQYKQQVRSEAPNIELNVDSLRAYLESSETVQWWKDYIASLGVPIFSIGYISRDVDMARRVGITTVNALDEMLQRSRGWGEHFLREFYVNTFGQLPVTGGSSDINAVVTLLIIGAYPDVFTDALLTEELGFGDPQRATVPARMHNPRFRHEQN